MQAATMQASPMRAALPQDWREGHFALRLDTPEGPVAIALRQGRAYDMTPAFGTVSDWLNEADPLAAIEARGEPLELDPEAALAEGRFLAPVDLQAIKACGVTYVRSMLERVIEERCRGDASRAEAVRAEVRGIIGEDLAALVPGSGEAMRLKEALVAKGWWSQYLEVGIGPDAEVFTKCQPMAAVGPAAPIAILASATRSPSMQRSAAMETIEISMPILRPALRKTVATRPTGRSNETPVSRAPAGRAVLRGPRMKSESDTARSPVDDKRWTRASRHSSIGARSAAGEALQRLPPTVPTLRTWWPPTTAALSASPRSSLWNAPCLSICRCVTSAPM